MQNGQFIEYLCDLVGSMWAEKLYDGNFEGLSGYGFEFIKETDFKEKPWYPSGAVNRARYSVDSENPVNGKTCQKIVASGTTPCTVGISQDGIFVDPSDPCQLRLWLRTEGISEPVRVRIHEEGRELASEIFTSTGEWKRYGASIEPAGRSTAATFTIEFKGPGTLWIDAASLMPANTVGGWRPDVVKALKGLKPGVIRIGGSVMDDPDKGAFEWQETIGDPDKRRPFRAWGGLQPTGPGLEEFVQLCYAVDAEPLICVRIREKTPRDAADQIEYFNGDASSPMGVWRAKNGRPEPYGVKYWQVGNEQGGEKYEAVLPGFLKAMKGADPTIELLASYPSEGVLEGGGDLLDYVCPHHYECEDLQRESDDLDRVRRMIGDRPVRIGITEWNTTGGDWGLPRAKLWTLANALACSRYQNLMHRNCDVIEIANRSNLTNSFCSGIIQTDRSRLYLTPTYYAQWLYGNYAGTTPLRVEPAARFGPGLDVSATLSVAGDVLTLFAVNDNVQRKGRGLTAPFVDRLKGRPLGGWAQNPIPPMPPMPPPP